MSAPDMLEIVNGPEDGTEFPISRAPVIVGMDLGCEVNVRLDEAVEPFHARLTAVPNGYRVRKINGGRLTVGGKGVGVFRSRVLREGAIMEVGNTEFCLKCAPDGLATRSQGVPTESDLFWTLRTSGQRLYRLVRAGGTRPKTGLGRVTRMVVVLFAGALVIGYVWPNAAAHVRYNASRYWGLLMEQINAMTGGPF